MKEERLFLWKMLKRKDEIMLDLELSSVAKKFLVKCDSVLYDRLVVKIKNLQENSFPSDSKRVVGRRDKIFRVGSYRILYMVISERNLLFISEIDKRSRVY